MDSSGPARPAARIRPVITATAMALAVTSFAAHVILFQEYHATRPTHPDPAAGLIYESSNHGHHVYLSAAEMTGLSGLIYLFFLGFLLAVIAAPKTFRILPSPPYQPVGPVKWRLDTQQPATPLTLAAFLGTIAVTATLIYLTGPWAETALAASGIVLRFGS